MNLLEEIQEDAITASSNLGSVLRKCKVLASRLGSKELEDWLVWESNGYPEDILVPQYRVWSLQLKGNFVGPFGSLENVPISTAFLPEKDRRLYDAYEFRLSITTVESILKKNETGMLQVDTKDMWLTLGRNVYRNMNCLQCWAEFSITSLEELLNEVRERILDFSLAVWKEQSKSDDINPNTLGSLSPNQVTHIFNTTVHNGSANVVGTANNSSIEFNIVPNDIEALYRVLKNNGVSEEDIVELKNAIAEDKPPQSPGQFGPKVSSWIAKMIQKASEGTWNIAIGVGANLLSEVLSKFYGL